MTDLPERLRRLYVREGANYVQEAADTIERLTAERDAIKARAFQQAADYLRLEARADEVQQEVIALRAERDAALLAVGEMRLCVTCGATRKKLTP